MMELWKPIIGYDDVYEVSNTGRVRSLTRYIRQTNRWGGITTRKLAGKELSPNIHNGYLQVTIRYKGKINTHLIHRLVAEAFIPNAAGLPCINHIDENKLNNNAYNLEWCTIAYNNRYGTHGKMNVGERNPNAKLSANDVERIRTLIAHGLTDYELSDMFHVSEYTIGRIRRGDAWRCAI